MTTPKPASAPPPDSLQAIVADIREQAAAHITILPSWLKEYADRIEALAASAQVREAEPAGSWPQSEPGYGALFNAIAAATRPEWAGTATGISVSAFLESLGASNPAAEPDAADWQSEIRRHDARTAAEPAPVAQGLPYAESMAKWCDKQADDPDNKEGRITLLAIAETLRSANDTIADHARRESELGALADAEHARAAAAVRERKALEASLAACRADADAAWIAAIDEAHQQTDAGLCIGYRAADRVKRRAREIIAAIDALRQEATHGKG